MELVKQITEAGIENCLFLVPMRPIRTYFGLISITSSSDPEIIMNAKISESRYKVGDNYKITLESTIAGFGKEHYYISDLENMISRGTVEFFVRGKK